jgi:hypothetical protein
MAEGNNDRLDANTGREWSDAKLYELGEMLVRGLSIAEIARRLRRDKVEIRDKIAEWGAWRRPLTLDRYRIGRA